MVDRFEARASGTGFPAGVDRSRDPMTKSQVSDPAAFASFGVIDQ